MECPAVLVSVSHFERPSDAVYPRPLIVACSPAVASDCGCFDDDCVEPSVFVTNDGTSRSCFVPVLRTSTPARMPTASPERPTPRMRPCLLMRPTWCWCYTSLHEP